MTDLMSAEDARKQIDQMLDEHGALVQNDATKQIMDAISRGCTEISLSVESGDVIRLTMFLENKGYKINKGHEQRDGSWFIVSW